MRRAGQGSTPRVQFLTAVFAVAFVFLVRQFWSEGMQMLRSFLLPGEAGVTEAAFAEMMTDLREGEPLGEAVTSFCRQVISSAQIID